MKSLLLFISLWFLVSHSHSSPWIEFQDSRLRYQISSLATAGILDISTSAWPLMWKDVAVAINNVERSELSKSQLLSLKEIEFELNRNKRQRVKKEISLFASNSSAPISSPLREEHQRGEIRKRFEYDGDSFAMRLDANLRSNFDGEYDRDLYGSYIAQNFGNWVVGAGAIERWWGPGQRSSLILSNNALPVPGFFIRTMGEQRFESKYLSWIGPWQFQMFVGQLEGSRHIPEAKLTGMRFSFRPFKNLELGASRAMQWGGEGRTQSFAAFFKSIASQGENTNEGSGNQLGGFDFTYRFSNKYFSPTVYAQIIGEDEAGYLPSKYNLLVGANADYWSRYGVSVFFEYTETAAGALRGDEQFNTSYEHFVFKSGYRYRGRTIGSSFDNDSKVLSVGIANTFDSGSEISVLLDSMNLNYDGVEQNSLLDSSLRLVQLSLQYRFNWRNTRVDLGGRFASDEFNFNDQYKRYSFFGALVYRY